MKRGAKRGGGGGGGKFRRPRQDHHREYRFDPHPGYGRREQFALPPPVPQRQSKLRVLGPCFRCGAYGHIQATCSAPPRTYPLLQSVVSTSAESKVPACVDDVCMCDELDVDDMCMGSGLFCECVDSTVCHPKNITACVSREEACFPVLNKSVNKVTTDIKSDGKHASRVKGDKLVSNYGTELRNDYNMVVENHYRGGDLATRFWESDSAEPQITHVQGRLKQRSVFFWKDVLHAPPPILDCIENGYRLPLKFIPPSWSQHNHQSAKLHREFVNEAVESLLSNRCIIKVRESPHLCNPLSVVANSAGKLRLVLNLKYLNKFLHVISFKYEDLHTAALMFEKGEYMFKFDLKSGYHHVDVHPDYHKFLGFQWEIKGVLNYFVFTVLPFGLSTACYLFTKLLRPLIRYWRGHGLKAIIYLDDGIVAVQGFERALHESMLVKGDLEKAGLVVNVEKSEWTPSNSIEWLGFLIDLSKGEFAIPEDKIRALKTRLLEIQSVRCVQARYLASVIGKINSMSLGLGPVSRLMTQSMYATLNTRLSWFQKLELLAEALEEVRFWLDRLKDFNGQDIWPKPSAVRVVYSDASATGYGGYTVEHGNLVANGQMKRQHKVLHGVSCMQ